MAEDLTNDELIALARESVRDGVRAADDPVTRDRIIEQIIVGEGMRRLDRSRPELSRLEGLAVVAFSWFVVSLFAAIPYVWSGLSIVDAAFESMSGLTTTGATVLTGLDELPVSILYYRQQLQWLGGMGIIVLAVAILPMLRVGGMQIFRMESSDKSEKVMPRAAQIASGCWPVARVA